MKTGTKIIVVLGVVILIALILFSVDLSKVNNNEKPIFCKQTQTYDDGGSIEYIGFGYKVIKYVNLEDDRIMYKIGTWFMKFDNPINKELKNSSPSSDYTDMKFDSKNIQTHLYIDDFKSPSVDIIDSVNDIKKYKKNFNDTKLNSALDEYTSNYFNNKVLVIVTIQESSGSNSNKVDRVYKTGNYKINISVQRKTAEIGTDDMAMWHLLVELDKDDIGNITDITIIDSTVKYF